mmetsp:Transcript_24849/g.38660  ORF Transcript_24849/g.38660 Transcript_24849/m.38660 type:complete len:83 (-) Transcript_24849:349-597(-)
MIGLFVLLGGLKLEFVFSFFDVESVPLDPAPVCGLVDYGAEVCGLAVFFVVFDNDLRFIFQVLNRLFKDLVAVEIIVSDLST